MDNLPVSETLAVIHVINLIRTKSIEPGMECVLKKRQKIRAGHGDAEAPGICPGSTCRPDPGFLGMNGPAHLNSLQMIHTFMNAKDGCRAQTTFTILDVPGTGTGKKIKSFFSVKIIDRCGPGAGFPTRCQSHGPDRVNQFLKPVFWLTTGHIPILSAA